MNVGILNETAVRMRFAGEEPLGRHVTIGVDGHDRPIRVVGVIADTRTRESAQAPGGVLFRPTAQTDRGFAADAVLLAVRTPAAPPTMPSTVRDALRRLAPGVPVGLGGASVLGRGFSSLLFQVPPGDPATYVAVSALVLAVAALALWIPARSAAATEAVEVVRDHGGHVAADAATRSGRVAGERRRDRQQREYPCAHRRSRLVAGGRRLDEAAAPGSGRRGRPPATVAISPRGTPIRAARGLRCLRPGAATINGEY